MEVFGWMCSILFGISYIPQLCQTIKSRSVEGVNLTMWIVTWLAYLCGLIYALTISKTPLIVGYGYGLLITTIFLYFYARSRRGR